MFRFKIGDFVVFKSAIESFKRFPDRSLPHIFTVTEQITQTCPGGTQYKYTLGDVEGSMFLDHHLSSLDELDAAILDVSALRKFIDEKLQASKKGD